MHGKKPAQEFVPFGETVLARPIFSEPLNRMNPRHKLGVWVRNNSAECFVGTAGGVFRAREVRRIEHQDRWDKEAINNLIGVPWRLVDGTWTVGRLVTQIDALPPPPVPSVGARVQGERITRTDIELRPSVPLQDAWIAMRSDLESEHKLTLTPAALESRTVSKKLQKDLSAWIDEERR